MEIKNPSEKTRCVQCGKFLVKYVKNVDLCQRCYRKYLKTFSFYEYREPKPKKGSKAEKICQYVITENLKPKQIAEKYGDKLGIHDVNYIRQIIAKHLYKCDTIGEERPRGGKW